MAPSSIDNPGEQRPPGQDEWSSYEQTNKSSLVKNEFEQKVYILDVPINRMNFESIMSLVTKELDTSFINDVNLKSLYQIQFENILEWARMGLVDLAELRLAKMFGELKLEKSIGGFERILQGATLTGSVAAALPAHGKLFPLNIFAKKEEKTTADTIGDMVTGGK